MRDLQSENLSNLVDRFFTEQISLNPIAAHYTIQEISDFYRENIAQLQSLIANMTPAQLAYKLPGAPSGSDVSGDETHFDTSQIVTHLASGTAFHWWGMTRALRHERPQFPRPPEGAKVTGKVKTGMGAGGWSGLSATELVQLLSDVSERFLTYVENLPEDIDKQATARYSIFGALTAQGWLFLAAIHSAMHLKQVLEIQTQPDYPI